MTDYPHPELRAALKRQADALGVPDNKFDDFKRATNERSQPFVWESTQRAFRAKRGVSRELYLATKQRTRGMPRHEPRFDAMES